MSGPIPVMGWIAIGTFLVGILWSVLIWLLGRHVKRTDALETSIHGENGLRDQVNRLITRAEFREALEKLEGTLEVINDEGHQRERRLLDSISNMRVHVDAELRSIQRETDAAARNAESAIRRVDSIDRRHQ